MNGLDGYDEFWMLNILILGLHPHMTKSVDFKNPKGFSETIKKTKEIQFPVWASRKHRLTVKSIEKWQKSQKQSQGHCSKHLRDDQQQNFRKYTTG